jgi:hypothetical protein
MPPFIVKLRNRSLIGFLDQAIGEETPDGPVKRSRSQPDSAFATASGLLHDAIAMALPLDERQKNGKGSRGKWEQGFWPLCTLLHRNLLFLFVYKQLSTLHIIISDTCNVDIVRQKKYFVKRRVG